VHCWLDAEKDIRPIQNTTAATAQISKFDINVSGLVAKVSDS